ncbi:PdaC/SigV domain-containing protein [Bacillus timonensis]|uniref:PdaC/SigV domain-containing protein n=1 Tax=Bacillus timonensis TaxID=1033734 RepID=UPI0002882B58|nr:DUF4163 domain-containing protein [Bacillus timonensis]
MKRFISLVFFCFGLMLAGCGNQQTVPTQQNDGDENTPTQQTETDENEEETTSNVDDNDAPQQAEEEENEDPFEIDSATYEIGKLTIHYPQLTKMKNKEMEQKSNHLMKEEAIQFLNEYQDSEAPLIADYEVILPDSDILSVLYTGDYNGGAYPTNLFFTTNIDWKKGEKIIFSDLFAIDETFLEILKNAKYVDWENPPEPNKEKQDAIIEYLNTLDTQNLIEAFKKADHPTTSENLFGIFSYYVKDKVLISIQVPHALGDHAEFELNMGDLVRK